MAAFGRLGRQVISPVASDSHAEKNNISRRFIKE
jgi:hypothetical protein